jgi:hypothetical protein
MAGGSLFDAVFVAILPHRNVMGAHLVPVAPGLNLVLTVEAAAYRRLLVFRARRRGSRRGGVLPSSFSCCARRSAAETVVKYSTMTPLA